MTTSDSIHIRLSMFRSQTCVPMEYHSNIICFWSIYTKNKATVVN